MRKVETEAKPATKDKSVKEPVRHRVILSTLPSELWPACQSVSRHIRDIHNTCVHLARTAISCFEWDKVMGKSILKAEDKLPLGGKKLLAAYAKAIPIPILNARRIKEKGPARIGFSSTRLSGVVYDTASASASASALACGRRLWATFESATAASRTAKAAKLGASPAL